MLLFRPLIAAVSNGQMEMVTRLLSPETLESLAVISDDSSPYPGTIPGEADPNLPNSIGQTPLMYAGK